MHDDRAHGDDVRDRGQADEVLPRAVVSNAQREPQHSLPASKRETCVRAGQRAAGSCTHIQLHRDAVEERRGEPPARRELAAGAPVELTKERVVRLAGRDMSGDMSTLAHTRTSRAARFGDDDSSTMKPPGTALSVASLLRLSASDVCSRLERTSEDQLRRTRVLLRRRELREPTHASFRPRESYTGSIAVRGVLIPSYRLRLNAKLCERAHQRESKPQQEGRMG